MCGRTWSWGRGEWSREAESGDRPETETTSEYITVFHYSFYSEIDWDTHTGERPRERRRTTGGRRATTRDLLCY